MQPTLYQPPTTLELLMRGINFRRPSVRRVDGLMSRFADSAVTANKIMGGGVQTYLRKYQRRDFVPPIVRPAGAEIAALPYDDAVQALCERFETWAAEFYQRLEQTGIGRIHWHDEQSCTFRFDSLSTTSGWLNKTTVRTSNTHDLVHARVHKLPAPHIPKPTEAMELINSMPQSLQTACRLVTGMLVVKDSETTATYKDPTMLGRTLTSMRDLSARAASFAADVVSDIASDLRARARGTQLALRDPVIILGEFCLYGWEE